MQDQSEKSWFQQPWPWFIFSIPLLTVIAGVITYNIAANQPHSMVQDDYFKKGLAINQSLAKQEQAKTLNIVAEIQIDAQSQLISVNLAGSAKPNELQLLFSHPTQEKLDQTIQLTPISQNEFLGQLPPLKKAYWHIRLTDSDETWLLKHRWHYPESSQLIIEAQAD